MFGTRMCGQTLLFIVIANCAIADKLHDAFVQYVMLHPAHVTTATDHSMPNRLGISMGYKKWGKLLLLLLLLSLLCQRQHIILYKVKINYTTN